MITLLPAVNTCGEIFHFGTMQMTPQLDGQTGPVKWDAAVDCLLVCHATPFWAVVQKKLIGLEQQLDKERKATQELESQIVIQTQLGSTQCAPRNMCNNAQFKEPLNSDSSPTS